MKDQFSLSDRVNEFKNAFAFKLISGLPIIASINISKKNSREIPEKEILASLENSSKVSRATSALLRKNGFDLIIPATFRCSDMIGEGYISRISSILGSAATVFTVATEISVDVWSVPNDKEVHKFIRLKANEVNPTLFRRVEILAPLSPEEIELLPPRHAARFNNKIPIERTVYRKFEIDLSGPNKFLLTIKEIFDPESNKIIQLLEPKSFPQEND